MQSDKECTASKRSTGWFFPCRKMRNETAANGLNVIVASTRNQSSVPRDSDGKNDLSEKEASEDQLMC